MALELKKAQRKRAKLKMGIAAPSGGGKTLGALLVAYGLMKEKYPNLSDDELWGKVAIIDTENGSGEIYVGRVVDGLRIGEYNAITLEPPFEADKYTKAIHLCVDANMEVVIIDSTTHLWAGQGGLLEQQGAIAKRTGNSYTAWRDVTPQHNRFVDTMLQSDVHIIATMRSKTDYVQEKNEQGKTTIRKVGLAPIQKDGMEYEFSLFLDIDADHMAFGSKDRTGLVDQKYFKISPQLGVDLMKFLESGVDLKPQVIATAKSEEEKVEETKSLKTQIVDLCKTLGGSSNEELMTLLKEFDPSGNPNKIKDDDTRKKLLDRLIKLAENTKETVKENE